MQYDLALDAIGWEQRGIQAREAGRHAEAADCFAKAVARSDRPLSWLGLAMSQIDQKQTTAALASLQRAHDLSPESGVVKHLLDSLSGRTSERAPASYITWLFNNYAEGFDTHISRLGYKGPEMLLDLARKAGWPADGRLKTLDMGCGTGLSGVPFRPYAVFLDGIDLSPGMLAQARQRDIYDMLHQGDIHAVLAQQPAASYDLALAADTLIYVGAVDELFREVARVLAPGGSFLFTVETAEQGFVLGKSGRYSHADAYLRDCAAGLLRCDDQIDGTIRIEAGKFTPARAYRFTKI